MSFHSEKFLLSPELQEFREVLRKFFVSKFPSELLRKNVLDPHAGQNEATRKFQSELWRQLIELGASAAGVPEELGGLGFGPQASAIVLEESARCLTPLPIFEMIAYGITPLLVLGNDSAKSTMLGQMVEGTLRVSGALQGLLSLVVADDISTTTLPDAKQLKDRKFHLKGACALVPSIRDVSGFFVAAKLGGKKGIGLFYVQLSDVPATAITFEPTFDLIRPFYRIDLKNTVATNVGRDILATADWQVFLDQLMLFVVAELVGVADKALGMTVDYVKTRNQFGQPIGSFQAVQHMLANMYLSLQELLSLNRFAAWSATNDPEQFHLAAISAISYASDAVPNIIERCIQLHGGIGFTFEYDLHLYLRRAQMLSRLFPTVSELYGRLGELALET